MDGLIRPDRARFLQGVEESLTKEEKAGLQVILDVLKADRLDDIETVKLPDLDTSQRPPLKTLTKEEVKKTLNKKYMESAYSINFNIKDDTRVKSAELRALYTKFSHLERLDFVKIITPEAIRALKRVPDSNLTSKHLEAILDALRALMAYYNLSEKSSEAKRSFLPPVIL